MTEALDPRLQALSLLLQVEQEVRRAEDHASLSYVFVNDTRSVLPARQAVFWAYDDLGRPRVQRASHVSEIDPNAALVRWLDRVAAWCMEQPWRLETHLLTRGDLPAELAAEWGETVSPYLMHLPLLQPRGGCLGGLLLAAAEPWVEAHLALARLLADAYGHAWQALAAPERRREAVRHLRQYWRRYVAAVVVLCLLPVRQYVLSPAEVVPEDPEVVAAPLSGVVTEVAVAPNQAVRKGDLLFRFEDTELANRLLVARRAFEVAQAEYLKNAQASFDCDSCRARVAQLQAVMEREQAQVDWASAQLAQGQVRASRDGIAVFTDANDLEGRPVRVGERIMTIADQRKVRLRILVPVNDAIATDAGTPVVFYPNVNPLASVDGRILRSSYEPALQPDQSMAFVLHARFDETGARLGWRGTAKIYGGRAPLIYQALRKPLARLRQLVGI